MFTVTPHSLHHSFSPGTSSAQPFRGYLPPTLAAQVASVRPTRFPTVRVFSFLLQRHRRHRRHQRHHWHHRHHHQRRRPCMFRTFHFRVASFAFDPFHADAGPTFGRHVADGRFTLVQLFVVRGFVFFLFEYFSKQFFHGVFAFFGVGVNHVRTRIVDVVHFGDHHAQFIHHDFDVGRDNFTTRPAHEMTGLHQPNVWQGCVDMHLQHHGPVVALCHGMDGRIHTHGDVLFDRGGEGFEQYSIGVRGTLVSFVGIARFPLVHAIGGWKRNRGFLVPAKDILQFSFARQLIVVLQLRKFFSVDQVLHHGVFFHRIAARTVPDVHPVIHIPQPKHMVVRIQRRHGSS
jgi:hypothetical protein